MKEAARKTRPQTRPKRSERVQILIKKEEDIETTNQLEVGAISSLDPAVKIEEDEMDLDYRLPKLESEKDKKH